MDMKISFDAKNVLQAAERAPHETADNVRKALLESCRLVQRGAREIHRFKPRSGALERAIRYRVNASNSEGTIDINPAIAPYGKYVHEPTGIFGPKHKPYDIYPRNKKLLRFIIKGRFILSRHVVHPGSPADQFLYNSAERNRLKINEIFERRMQMAIKAAGLE